MIRLFSFSRPSQPLRLSAVFVSETGLVRADNQDNVLVAQKHGVFCVADGLGGGVDGGRASGIVCESVKAALPALGLDFRSRVSTVRRALALANESIYTLAQRQGRGWMGSTAAAVVFDPSDNARLATVSVGDTRVYLVRGGMAKRLTRDHRVSGETILTRAVGVRPTLSCDVEEFSVRSGDRLVICTDGVHGVMSDGRIAVYASGGTIETAAERLANGVVRAGAPDNYSFVLIGL